MSNLADGMVSVLLNLGDGTLADKLDLSVGNEPSAVAIGDVTGRLARHRGGQPRQQHDH